jgi:hypothetical protein
MTIATDDHVVQAPVPVKLSVPSEVPLRETAYTLELAPRA